MRAWRLLAASLFALVLPALVLPAGAAVVPATSAESAGPCPQPLVAAPVIDRVWGADRYATAACASMASYPGATGGAVVLARGDAAGGFADALAGAVLGHALDAPVLLTGPHALPVATRLELARLAPARVLVLGGEEAVHGAVMREVAALLPTAAVERLAGQDRYATASEVSAAVASTSTLAFVVNGFRPPDALVAAAPAARMGAALLLTAPAELPAPTRDALVGVTDVVIVGGYGAVPEPVEADLAALVGAGHVRRVSGGDRAETAASLARAFPAAGRVHLVGSGDAQLADAVTAGWSAALPGGGPALFSDLEHLAHGTDRYLRLGGLAGMTGFRLVGGPAVLPDALVPQLIDRVDEALRGGPPTELRAIWAHLFDAALKSPRGIDALLDAAAAANLNTVVVQVARRQDAYYTSAVLPRTPDPGMPRDLDLLARLLPAARDRGLAVHAWIAVLPAWHEVYTGLPLPVWDAHGPGSPDPWVSQTRDGVQGTMLDPGVPAVVQHAAAVAAEIAARYPVDAVHLDYVRYESQDWGYHPTSLVRFREAHGLPVDFVPAVDDARWDDWRRRMTRDLVVAVGDAVRAAAPDVAVTLAGSAMGEPPGGGLDYTTTRTWQDVFQAWPDWVRAGAVDAVFPMAYFREPSHAAWFDGWSAFAGRVDDDCDSANLACVVAVGQAGYLNTVPDAVAQLARARPAADGLVIYSYQQDSSDGPPGALLAALAASEFAEPAGAPALHRPGRDRG